MITLEEKKERLFMALAGGVLVITGFQCFWFLTVNGSILQAVSIVISIAIVVTLLKLDKAVAYKIENCDYRQGGKTEAHALYAKSPSDCKAYCNREVAEYLANIKNKLDRAEQLVKDAVTNLIVSFNYIGELTTAQSDMVMAIEKMVMTGNNSGAIKLLRRQMMVAKKVEQELTATVTAMQFGDLVVQLLEHTERQINTLDFIVQRINPHISQEKRFLNLIIRTNKFQERLIR